MKMDELIKRIKNISEAQAAATADIAARIDELQQQLEAVCQPFEEAKAELMAELKPMAIAHGQSYKSEWGTVKFRRGYTRYSWDNKALNGFAAAHPEILEFRRETEVGPSVKVV
jgi:hypothetical protein